MKNVKKKIINLTPHAITLIDDMGNKNIIPSNGTLRVSTQDIVTGMINNIPTYKVNFSGVDLPEEIMKLALSEQAIFIVSKITLDAIKQKYPDIADKFYITHKTVRDKDGVIIGARGLAQ